MTYSADTPILGKGTVSAAAIQQFFIVRGKAAAPQFAPDEKYKHPPDDVGQRIVTLADSYGINSDMMAAQIGHESAWWQSRIVRDKNNPSGLGATNDAPYENAITFERPVDGIRATIAHLLSYVHGDDNPIRDQSYRHEVLRNAGYLGVASVWGDLNGRWAWPGETYAQSIAARANDLVTFANEHEFPPEQEDDMAAIKIALAAGHRNSDGGNAIERELVAEHCYQTAQALRAAGADVRVVTPDDGRGVFSGGLQAVAQRVVDWHNEGWTANLFLEFHTNGPGGRGVFAIYPDSGNDVDTDVRDTLGPAMAQAIAKQTGMPVWQNGIMSERNTGVGRQGHRLGVFLRSEPLRTTTERMLIESGFHSDARDLAILRKPETPGNIAAGVVEAVFDFYGVSPSDPKESEDPNARYFEETGHWIINADTDDGRITMLDHWRNGRGINGNGYPISGMSKDDDGVYRQLTENTLMEAWPPGTWGDNKEVVYRNGAVGRRWRDAQITIAELQAEIDGHEECDCT